MKQSDLFVLSSHWEGLPLVVVEALASGTPVVATDCPHGPREIISDGYNGRLVPVGDVAKLSEAMEVAMTRAELRGAWSTAGQESADRFRPEVIAREYAMAVGLDRLAGV
jgi:glycosyltransferase involved in cell wall biosynthesis